MENATTPEPDPWKLPTHSIRPLETIQTNTRIEALGQRGQRTWPRMELCGACTIDLVYLNRKFLLGIATLKWRPEPEGTRLTIRQHYILLFNHCCSITAQSLPNHCSVTSRKLSTSYWRVPVAAPCAPFESFESAELPAAAAVSQCPCYRCTPCTELFTKAPVSNLMNRVHCSPWA